MKRIIVSEKLNELQLSELVSVLKKGGLVVYPTETCYGIGALATSEIGVTKLLDYKRRIEGKAISVAVSSRNMAERYVELSDAAKNIYENFLPGPVTVISKSKSVVDSRLESEMRTLGIRIPDHSIPLQIIDAVGEGITATSANVSGGKTPYSVDDILKGISEKRNKMIDLILDFGQLPKRPSSVVIDTTLSNPKVLRGEDLLNSMLVSGRLLGRWQSGSEAETKTIAGKIWDAVAKKSYISGPIVILLTGELGAGKTQFVKGLAGYLGIKENISSPTFIIERQYKIGPNQKNSKGAKILYHYDLWRLEEPLMQAVSMKKLLNSIGLDRALGGRNVIAIEWPEKVAGLGNFLKNDQKNLFLVKIDQTGKNKRLIKLLELD